MEGMLSANDQQRLVSSFLEIAVGQTAETARQFLQATSWKLEEAIQLFFVGSEGGMFSSASQTPAEAEANNQALADQSCGGASGMGTEDPLQNDVDEIRPPLPVVRETLYGDSMFYGAVRAGNSQHEPNTMIAFRNFSEEMKRPGIWESDQGTSSASASGPAAAAPRDNLASLYRPPFHLMFHGSFEQAKSAASAQDRWLLVNLQSTTEFSSHTLNRDTWANEAVSQTVSANFIFWQVYDDTTEGRKVCTYYKLESIPVVLVIDPTTGQKMRSWCGMIEPENLLEDLVPFMDGGPKEHLASLSKKRPRGSSLTPHSKPTADDTNDEDEELQRAVAASLESMKEPSDKATAEEKPTGLVEKEETCSTNNMPTYPTLPEEPKGDRSFLCRVGVRLPSGRRVQRNFLKSDPIQLLWSFCYSQLEESERKPFKLTQAIPGAVKTLEYESNLTLEQSGLANSMISVTWE